MTEFFNYDPSDFQVLEDLEFDETIQRPEKVRYYTIDEQLADAYEKMIPKERVKSFQLQKLKKETDRMRELYNAFVVPTAETYELRPATHGTTFDWIFPVYASSELRAYWYGASWNPLFSNPNIPGFYPRMLSALPRPFVPSQDGVPYSYTGPAHFVNSTGESPLRALPTFLYTRTQRHEDKTFTIVKVPADGTGDDMRFTGYFLAKRPLDIPNPMQGHPFFGANEPTLIESTAPLSEVVPSVDAVLTHGVPVTSDPYGKGLQYVKLYDIALRDIPWSSWKSRFPPAERVDVTAPVVDLPYPTVQQDKPGDALLTLYKTKYAPGLSTRFWLQNQVDGGELVIRMLLSQAIENGSVEAVPGVDVGPVDYPASTMEECALTGIGFQEFVTRGLLRHTERGLACVPLEFVKQERSRLGYAGRTQWKEDTGTEILRTYQKVLERARKIRAQEARVPEQSRTPVGPESVVRREIVEVLSDPRRTTDDKLRDVKELTKDTLLTDSLYKDAAGAFVLCSHTLAVLEGALADNRLVFYSTWTVVEGGARVCKFCGEHVATDVLMEQDEYDENGFIIRRADVLDGTTPVFKGDSLSSFVSGLGKLRPAFNMDSGVDDICYALLSILQVLPSASAVLPLLQKGREFAGGVVAATKTKPGSAAAHTIEGIGGIAITILLIQSHIPALIPRRSFGARPLKLSGYPRDAPVPEEYSILDSILAVIRKTYEAYPTAITGPSAAIIRATLTGGTSIRNKVKSAIDAILKKTPAIRDLLTEARAHVEGVPVPEEPKTLIPLVNPPAQFDTVKGYPECPSARAVWNNGRAVSYSQPVMPLDAGLGAGRTPAILEAPTSERALPARIGKPVIAERYKKRTAIKKIKLELTDEYRTNLMLASYLADTFELPIDVRSVDPTQSPDELRDIAKGFVYEALVRIDANEVMRVAFEEKRRTDIALFALLANPVSERAKVNTLRATERLTFVERMAAKTDMDRLITKELIATGTAPYIITNEDRQMFAAELLARELAEVEADEDLAVDDDVGVGRPTEPEDAEEDARGRGDDGDYGNNAPLPRNDGRDYEQPQMNDDEENAI